MEIKELIARLIEQKTVRKLYVRLADDHVLDEDFSPVVFTPNEGYFQIRLSEMFLRDRRSYWQGFVPLGIVVSDFIYSGERRTIPFFVGNQILKGIEQYTEKEYVEYFNTRIVGPVPYVGDGIALFVGLFRSQVTNLAEKLFNVVESLVGVFDATRLSEYLDIAGPLSKGLSDLLDMQEVELRVGNRDVFSDKANDPNCFREGYLAYVNCAAGSVSTDELWVKDGRLFAGKDRGSAKPFTDCDYCLVKVEHLPARNDYTTLPFHRKWEAAQACIFDGNPTKARALLVELVGHVAASPDLTQSHRYHLIQAYSAQFERAVGIYAEVKGPGPRGDDHVSRGVGLPIGPKQRLSPKASIQSTALAAEQAGVPKEVVRGLFDISRNWEGIPFPAQPPQAAHLTDAALDRQIKALQTISTGTNRDPKALADAIILGTLRAH